MTPKNANEMWIEEYAHALTAFNIAVDRLRIAVDHIWKENAVLREQVEKEYTLEEIKDKYFANVDWETLRSREDREFILEWMKEDDSN